MSEFTYESLAVVMRGGSIPGPRTLRVSLDASDQNDPRLLAALEYIRSRLDEQMLVQAPSFGGIS